MAEPVASRSRRRVSVLAAVALAVLLIAGVVAAVQLRPPSFALVPRAQIGLAGMTADGARGQPVDPAGDGLAVCALVSIAVAGPLTGPHSPAGAEVRDGVRLAVDDHNGSNPGCQVQLKVLDTHGSERQPTAAGLQIVDDVYTIGMIGPASSEVGDELRAALVRSGLVTAAVTAAAQSVPPNGSAFFRGIPGITAQGRAIGNHLAGPDGYRTICVADDGTPYGSGLARAVTAVLDAERVGCSGPQSLRDNDIDSIAAAIESTAPEAVYFGGSAERAGELLARLRQLGITGDFLSATEVDGEAIFRHLGEDPDRVTVSMPQGPDPDWFVDEFSNKFGRAPGDLTAVGYDLATIMLRGVDAGMLTRPQMADWLRRYDGQGVAHRYRWAPDGELADPTVWLYDIEKR